MTKLTRQERKEALAEWDRRIFICASTYDLTGDESWKRISNELQVERAARLAELEGSAK